MKTILFVLIIGSLFSIETFAQNRMNRNMPSPNNGYNYSHRQYSQRGSNGTSQIPGYTPRYDKAYNQIEIPKKSSLPLYNSRQLYEYKNLYDYLPR